jgi:hypothetical protein
MKDTPEEAQSIFRCHEQQTLRPALLQVIIDKTDQRIESRFGLFNSADRIQQNLVKIIPLVPRERIKQILLGGKITVKGAAGHACQFAHLKNGNTISARKQHHFLGGLQNAVDSFL